VVLHERCEQGDSDSGYFLPVRIDTGDADRYGGSHIGIRKAGNTRQERR
jgi:hypothetical protein